MLHSGVGRDVRTPLLAVLADEVIDDAGELLQAGDLGVGICALEPHADNMFTSAKREHRLGRREKEGVALAAVQKLDPTIGLASISLEP